MAIKFVIPGRLPGLNDYVRACRSGYHAGNTMKQVAEEKILGSMLEANTGRLRAGERVFLRFTWIEPNTRRDMDNIAFAKKFILDAIKKYGLIADDGQKYMAGFSDSFGVDKDNPRIEVEIFEVDNKTEIWQFIGNLLNLIKTADVMWRGRKNEQNEN